MLCKEPRTLIVKEKGLAPVFLDSRLEHPAGWICARYISSVLYRRAYSTVDSLLSECLWKTFTGDSGGIQTHDLLTSLTDQFYNYTE